MLVVNARWVRWLMLQAAYDQILKAKKAAELRHRELNSKRRKFKEGITISVWHDLCVPAATPNTRSTN